MPSLLDRRSRRLPRDLGRDCNTPPNLGRRSTHASACAAPAVPFPRCRGRCWLPALLALTGCAQIPTIPESLSSPTCRRRSGAPVPADRCRSAAANALTQAACGAGARTRGALERQLAVEQDVAGSPLYTGNQVNILRDGQQTFGAIFNAIRQPPATTSTWSTTPRGSQLRRAAPQRPADPAAAEGCRSHDLRQRRLDVDPQGILRSSAAAGIRVHALQSSQPAHAPLSHQRARSSQDPGGRWRARHHRRRQPEHRL